MDPLNQDFDPLKPSSQVWPPPPTNSFAAVEPSPLSPIESFRVQNFWLVLFLTIITFGIYGVFWLKRQIAVVNSLRSDVRLSQGYANLVLVFTILSVGLAFTAGATHSNTLDQASSILARVVALMTLFLLFYVRNGINMLLRARKGGPYWFSGLFTWLFAVPYLQYKINKNFLRWRSERQGLEANR